MNARSTITGTILAGFFTVAGRISTEQNAFTAVSWASFAIFTDVSLATRTGAKLFGAGAAIALTCIAALGGVTNAVAAGRRYAGGGLLFREV